MQKMNYMYGIDDKCSRVVVHLLKAVNETTSGYKEFAVWRKKHVKHEINIVIACGKRMESNKKNFSELEVIWGNGDVKRIRKKVKEILSICREKKIPVVFHIQQVAAIAEIMRACAGLGIRNKMVYTERNSFCGYNTTIKKSVLMSALYAKHLTFLSYASYEEYPKIVKWLKHNNMSLIEHGANGDEITKIDWSKRKVISNSPLELVYTARIVPVKNHRFLLDVMEKIDGVHITFIGGEQYPVIQNEIKRRHLESKITITGIVNREEVYKILANGDAYISPSTLEGLPVSVLEAMHAGLPLILSNIKPHIELAKKTDGIIVLPLEKELWINELNHIKKLEIECMADMGERNADAAKQFFTLDKMHRRYSRLYSSLE